MEWFKKNGAIKMSENVILVYSYFSEQAKVNSSDYLWPTYSMLKATIQV